MTHQQQQYAKKEDLHDEEEEETIPNLPIDEHEETIMKNIQNHRVTIIHGETGCGKSSRVPIFILKGAQQQAKQQQYQSSSSSSSSHRRIKMFISQPRRIAAKALVERVRSKSSEAAYRNCFALRMGHGYREYESSETQAWFVTTGYLTRLLANHPEQFTTVTHIVIDEVHERSVDTDILCWLCRRLVQTHPHIRLVLMSATLATKLYQEYFSTRYDDNDNNRYHSSSYPPQLPPPPIIHVGVKRFPITEHFIENLSSPPFAQHLTHKELQAVQAIVAECESSQCRTAPPYANMTKRYQIAARLVSMIGRPGSSVLIFVPGMNDIIEITELLEEQERISGGTKYRIYPIHSDIPFEDQMAAFEDEMADNSSSGGENDEDDEEETTFSYGLQQHTRSPIPTKRNLVKVIIATNAAESSVTLPNVDHVLCLGLCRQIIYNAASHRQVLVPTWISRASAKQRAGRTGRLRPGHVYRLYTRTAHESYLDEFDPGEMVRIPLDQVILTLKELLHDQEAVIPVLQGCIEPPNVDTIERSFQSLYRWNFISQPNDDMGAITRLGSFVSALGIDLALGSLIGLGIQFGVAAEVLELAATLSFPKTPFQMTNPLIHDPVVYNEIASATYRVRCHFDSNLYSDPLALMNLLWDYDLVTGKAQFCKQYRLAWPRMQQLVSTRNSIRTRVADFLGIDASRLQVKSPPTHMPHAKITLLRILQVWVFSDTVIECAPVPELLASSLSASSTHQRKKPQALLPGIQPSVLLPLMVPISEHGPLTERHLEQVLDGQHRHPYQLLTVAHVEQHGEFEYHHGTSHETSFCLLDFVEEFQKRLLSYVLERYGDKHTENMLVWCWDEHQLHLYCRKSINSHNGGEDPPTTTLVDRFCGDLLSDYDSVNKSLLVAQERSSSANRRGILERKCGAWSIHEMQGEEAATMHSTATSDNRRIIYFQKYCISNRGSKRITGPLHESLTEIALQKNHDIRSILSWDFTSLRKGKKSRAQHNMPHFLPSFLVSMRGEGTSEIGKLDLKDLLGVGGISHLDVATIRNAVSQSVLFPPSPNQPIMYQGKDRDNLATSFLGENTSSWNRPTLFSDIPEGARLLSVLASGQRRSGHMIRFSIMTDTDSANKRTPKKKKNGGNNPGENVTPTLNVKLRDETNISQRWKRLGTDKSVYVPENTVPASATSVTQVLFCCCANTLEVQGGGVRVDGLTVLPPNPLFLLLSFMSFGLLPNLSISDILARNRNKQGGKKNTKNDLAVIEKGILWLESRLESQRGRTTKYKNKHNDELHFGLPSFQVVPEAATLPSPAFGANDTQGHNMMSSDTNDDDTNGEVMQRLQMAVEFHKSCGDMGEELVCFTDKIHTLCQLFDTVDGQEVSPWRNLEETSLTPKNLKQWRYERRTRKDESQKQPTPNQTKTAATNPLDVLSSMIASSSLNDVGSKDAKKASNASTNSSSAGFQIPVNFKSVATNKGSGSSAAIGKEKAPNPPKERFVRGALVKRFPEPVLAEVTRLFATQLGPGEQVRPDELVSTNILSLLVQVYSDLVLEQSLLENRETVTKKRVVSLNHESWTVMSFKEPDGRELYQAKFVNDVIPLLPLFGRGKNKVPKWMKKHNRPNRLEDVEKCTPPIATSVPKAYLVRVAKDGNAVLFETVAAALQMEASFWLERQFCSAGKSSIRHWYDHTFPEMMQLLRKHFEAGPPAPKEEDEN